MLNKKNRIEAIEMFESYVEKYELERAEMIKESENLYGERIVLKEIIKKVWQFLNDMRNKPNEIEITVRKLKIEFKRFESFVEAINDEIDKTFKQTAGGIGTGVAAGASVAAFGPAAAMAIATTFGTASTGTAISALSGAAATNAALAWLGGGALVAGGGGTAAGTTLLTLSGPIGWTIGGISLVGAGLFRNAKNKKVANEAREKAIEVKKQTIILQGINEEIRETTDLTKTTNELIDPYYNSVLKKVAFYQMDYNLIKEDGNNELIQDLGSLINQTKAATELLNRAIGKEA